MSSFPANSKIEPPDNWIDRKHLIDSALRQVEKDFALQGLQLSLKNDSENYAELVELLADKIEALDLVHSEKLAGVLYQIDLSEREIRNTLTKADGSEIYTVLANQILQRCFQKVVVRENFST